LIVGSGLIPEQLGHVWVPDIAPCSEEKHQVHNSSFVGDGFSLFCTFSSHKKEEEL
jgi:hypothetical protein